MNVFCIGPEQIDALWPLYGHHLERLERETGLVYAGQIRKDLRAASKQLWGYQHGPDIIGVAITSIYELPRGTVCEIYAACGTGSRSEIKAIVDEITRWARAQGCVQVRVLGRRGWLRVLTDFAYRGVILEKDLT